MHCISRRRSSAALVALALIVAVAASSAQQAAPPARTPDKDTLADGPQVFNTPEQRFSVVPLKGLSR
jgi:hypothetical protein